VGTSLRWMMPRWKRRGWDAGGEFDPKGAEWKATDKLARSLYDMMKPKVMMVGYIWM